MNDNSCVPVPYDYVPGLWPRHSLKSWRPGIQVFGVRIRVRESSVRINVMYQMRTVAPAMMNLLPIECSIEHRVAIFRCQGMLPLCAAMRCSTGRFFLSVLGMRQQQRHAAERGGYRGFRDNRHGPILMPIVGKALVTVVQGPPGCELPFRSQPPAAGCHWKH